MRNKAAVLLCLCVIFTPISSFGVRERVEITTSEEDTKYLFQLAKDTWDCMDSFVSPVTGFPFDTDRKPDTTNTTNIGLYLASLSVATEMGFIPKDKASKRAEAILDSLLKLQNWNGFIINTVNVFSDTKASDGGHALADFNKLPAGIIMARQEFPALNQKCTTLLNRIKWSLFYNPATESLYGGYDVAKGEVLDWPMNLLASDTRLAAFFVIASGAAPADCWYNLNRDTEEHYGLKIFKPCWYGGGLFMQGICGLFLDERQTEMGKSMADFAYAQMLLARETGSTVWGWSACYSPWGQYLGWGGLRGNVVTPHASALAIIYYPNKVTQNLRTLEKFGLREKYMLFEDKYPFGFRDSIDIDTRQTYNGFVTGLDQGMFFLSLANYLGDGIVWKIFEKDLMVKNGKQKLEKYFSAHSEYIGLYKKRDSEGLSEKNTKDVAPAGSVFPIDDFSVGAGANKINARRGSSNCQVSLKPNDAETGPGSVQIDYDLVKNIQAAFFEEFISFDLSPYNALSFQIKGDRETRFTNSLRIEFEGKNNGAVYIIKGIADNWRKMTVPLREFGAKHTGWSGTDSYWGGFITDKSEIKKLSFVFDLPNVSEGKGRIYLKDLCFESIAPENFEKSVLSLIDIPDSPIWKDGVLDDFETTAGWSSNQARGASFKVLIATGKNGNSLEMDYDLGNAKTPKWAVIEKDFYISLEDNNPLFKFLVKYEGSENNLEFKLVDTDGSTFGKKMPLTAAGGQWRAIAIRPSELFYWWGGDAKLDRINKISFAVSTKNGGKGTVFIDDLTMIYTSRLVRAVKIPSSAVR